MYKIHPRKLYVMDWALRDERNVRRMERMVRGMGRQTSEVQAITAEQLPQIIRENRWIGEVRQGAYIEHKDPDIIFTAFKWVSPQERARVCTSNLFKECVDAHIRYGDCKQGYISGRVQAILGVADFFHYEQRPQWDPTIVCWSLYDLHSAWGCLHRCAYCQRGSVYVINLNLEEFVEHVDQLLAENPWQKTFRYDVEQDVLAIEPEYGACEMLVRDFAKRSDQFLILFSKSANVDHLLHLPHNGHTIMLWTLSTHTVSRRYEPRTATMEERIEAAYKCQQAGYNVRFKCKPVIPIRGWREEITHMLELMYSKVQPDNLSVEMVFFDSVAEMDATLGLENLDPEFVAAAKQEEERVGQNWPKHLHGPRPFTFEAKLQVYRHFITESRRLSPTTPVTLCAEAQRYWDALSDVLDWKPWNYVCNCGPHCKPGLRRVTMVEGPDAERIQQAQRGGAVPANPNHEG